MALPLRETLVRHLRDAFAEDVFFIGDADGPVAVFPAKHPHVGDAVIYDDDDELTVLVGKLTHRHFGNYDNELSPEERADKVASEATSYLKQLFSDQLELFGNGAGGGSRPRSAKPRGLLSRLFLGRKTYVWSGPLHGGDA